MPRIASLSDAQWFELADVLAASGQPPSAKSLHASARERYGVAASFTTIQRALDSWRRCGGQERPAALSPQFLEIVLNALSPLYQQLLGQARSEFEPRVIEAERLAAEAGRKVEAAATELQHVTGERQHLREQLQVAGDRERTQAAAVANARGKVAELQAALDATLARHQQQVDELQLRRSQQDERHQRERAQLTDQHQASVAQLRETHAAEIAALARTSREELERRDQEITALRQTLAQSHELRSALTAQKQVLASQLADALEAQGKAREQVQDQADELRRAQGRLQRTEQALRGSKAANTQMEAAYQQRINTLQMQLETLAQGQVAIQQHVGELARQIASARVPPPVPASSPVSPESPASLVSVPAAPEAPAPEPAPPRE